MQTKWQEYDQRPFSSNAKLYFIQSSPDCQMYHIQTNMQYMYLNSRVLYMQSDLKMTFNMIGPVHIDINKSVVIKVDGSRHL